MASVGALPPRPKPSTAACSSHPPPTIPLHTAPPTAHKLASGSGSGAQPAPAASSASARDSSMRETASVLLSISPRLQPLPAPTGPQSKRTDAALGLLSISPKLGAISPNLGCVPPLGGALGGSAMQGMFTGGSPAFSLSASPGLSGLSPSLGGLSGSGRPLSPPAMALDSHLGSGSHNARVRRNSIDSSTSNAAGCRRARSESWPLDMSALTGAASMARGGGGGGGGGSSSGGGGGAFQTSPAFGALGAGAEFALTGGLDDMTMDLDKLPHLTHAEYNKGGRIGIYTPKQRQQLLARWRAKRLRRTWRKKIRYNCRKNLADTRVRVKGRFVKRTELATIKAKSDSAAAAEAPAPGAAEAEAAAPGAAPGQPPKTEKS